MSSHAPGPDQFTLGAHKWRTDCATARTIETSLALQATGGTCAAAALLRAEGVDIAIAARVLGRPLERRKRLAPGLRQPGIYGGMPLIAYRETGRSAQRVGTWPAPLERIRRAD